VATMTIDALICEGESKDLMFDLSGGRGGYTVTYQVSDSAIIYSTTANTHNILVTPLVTTTYTLVNVVDQSGLGCSSGDLNLTQTIEVVPLPVAEFTGNETICAGESTELLVYFSKGMQPFSVTYTDGTNTFQIDDIYGSDTIRVSPNDSTVYTLLTINDGSGAQCTGSNIDDIAPINVLVKALPVIDFDLIGVNEGCAPFTPEFQINTPLAEIGELYWDFGDLTKTKIIVPDANDVIKEHPYNAGEYQVSLTIVSPGEKKCLDTKQLDQLIISHLVPVADFEFFPTQVSIVDPQVNFYNQSLHADSYEWMIDGVEQSDGVNFSNAFSNAEAASYEVTLISTADVKPACDDTTRRTVVVLGELFVNIPNSFTPNNDGINDVFAPVIKGFDPENYLFEVYNRWGGLIFSSTDSDKGWNGKNKGEDVPSDLYIWKLEVKSKYEVEKQKSMGQIRLIR
jgi:gliding motility-associated-like protein